MQYSLVKFDPKDWHEIEPREEAAADLEALKSEAIFKEIYTGGMPFFTLRYGEEIIVIYGFMYSGNGTFHPAIIPGKNLHKHTKKIVKLFYEYFATYVPRMCRRMETYCDIMDTKAIRLAKHFGFEVIGIRHNASAAGHDQVILERLTTMDPRKIKR